MATHTSPPTALLPEIRVPAHLLRRIRTLLFCSTAPSEHLADLHTSRPTPTTLCITHLTLPSPHPSRASPTPTIRLTSPPLSRPPAAFAPPLTALATLYAARLSLSFTRTLPTFVHALEPATVVDARDARVLAQTALAIVLAGGDALHEGERAGPVVRRRGRLEVLRAEEADADAAGVWVLGDGVEEAVAGLAAVAARRRNRKIGKGDGMEWVGRELVVVRFGAGGVQVGGGWMRVLCGGGGGRVYTATVGEVGEGGEAVGRFVLQGGEGKEKVGRKALGGGAGARKRVVETARRGKIRVDGSRRRTHGGADSTKRVAGLGQRSASGPEAGAAAAAGAAMRKGAREAVRTDAEVRAGAEVQAEAEEAAASGVANVNVELEAAAGQESEGKRRGMGADERDEDVEEEAEEDEERRREDELLEELCQKYLETSLSAELRRQEQAQ